MQHNLAKLDKQIWQLKTSTFCNLEQIYFAVLNKNILPLAHLKKCIYFISFVSIYLYLCIYLYSFVFVYLYLCIVVMLYLDAGNGDSDWADLLLLVELTIEVDLHQFVFELGSKLLPNLVAVRQLSVPPFKITRPELHRLS